ncbi:hypothetical protein [Taklimakanibacter deserti]|uniref:hypothetical protein n=1 Tax=Taklimakanibacter deserti TaxID=2267839 RepID=UPI000E64E737
MCLAASAHARLAPEPLVHVWVAPKPLTTVQACIVKALDAHERTYSRISPSVRHVAKTLVPREVVEIRPVRDHAVADEDHYVRLERIAGAITRIAFHSSEEAKVQKKMTDALSPCGSG